MIKDDLSIQIVKYRTTHKLSQNELATKLGISQASVAAWEAGKSYPQGKHYNDLIELLAKPDLATENTQLKQEVSELKLMLEYFKDKVKKLVGGE